MLVQAARGHNGEFGMLKTGISNTLPPYWIILLHRNCTNNPFSHTSTSDLQSCLLLSNFLFPVTTKFDLHDRVKKASSTSAHNTASTGLLRSSMSWTLLTRCGDRGAACLTMCCFALFRPFRVNFSSMLPAAANGRSTSACSVRIPLT